MFLRRLLEFSSSQDITKQGISFMKSLLESRSNIIESNDIDKLLELANDKTKEQKRKTKTQQIKSKLKIDMTTKSMKVGLHRFKKDVKQLGMVSVIKQKMKNFLNRARSKKGGANNGEGFQLGDFKDYLEEFLCSDNTKIGENTLLVEYFKQDQKHVLMLIKFITSPYSYSLSYLFIERHRPLIDKFGEIYIEKIRTFRDYSLLENAETEKLRKIMAMAFGTHGIEENDDPEQEIIADKSIYFIRAFCAAMVLSDRDNHMLLAKYNSIFVEEFCIEIEKSMKTDIIVNHLKLILYLYRFYMQTEPARFLKGFLKHGLLHQLLHNIDREGVVDFLVSLMNPADHIQSLPDHQQLIMWRYAKESGLFQDLADISLFGHKGLKRNKFDKSYISSELLYIIDLIDINGYEIYSTPLQKLIYNDAFYLEDPSMYLISEDFLDNKSLDIDRIFEYDTGKSLMRNGSIFRRNSKVFPKFEENKQPLTKRTEIIHEEPTKNELMTSRQMPSLITKLKLKTGRKLSRNRADKLNSTASKLFGRKNLSYEVKKGILLSNRSTRIPTIQRKIEDSEMFEESMSSSISIEQQIATANAKPIDRSVYYVGNKMSIVKRKRDSLKGIFPRSQAFKRAKTLVASNSLKLAYWFEMLIHGKRRKMRHPEQEKPSTNANQSSVASPKNEDDDEKSELNPEKIICEIVSKEAELILRDPEFDLNMIEQIEYLSCASAKALYFIVLGGKSYDDSQFSKNLGTQPQEIIYFWEALLKSPPIIETIMIAFLKKFVYSVKYPLLESTGYYLGRTLVLIMSELIESTIVQKYRRDFLDTLLKYSSYIDDLLYKLYKLTKHNRPNTEVL